MQKSARVAVVLSLVLAVVIGLEPTSRVIAAEHDEPTKVGDVSFKCATSAVETVDRKYGEVWDYNQELAANAFAIFAAASYDAYEPRADGSRAFRIADNNPELGGDPSFGTTGWKSVRRQQNRSGLSYDIYSHLSSERLLIMVAYRGTDDWIGMDLLANLSWVTQWLNPWDQYRQARNEFTGIVSDAVKLANGKPIAFIVTGHSLGGGLAQHIAHRYPCTSAVVFNSSFVTNTALFGKYSPRILRVYEKGDKFEQLASKVVNTTENAVYRLNLTGLDGIKFNHNMERFAAGTSRMALACVTATPGCEIRDSAAIAKTLYCGRYFGVRWKKDPKFAERTADRAVCNDGSS